MIAFVTTIGEPTTDLCVWSLKRNGFEVHTVSSDTTLAEKLKFIYDEAYHLDIDFIRVDADVIVNRSCNPQNIKLATDYHKDAWWVQFQTWGWYSQSLICGGVQFIKKEALPALRDAVNNVQDVNRPETALSRIEAFYKPRRFESFDIPMGIHGYGIKDLKPIIQQKAKRGQSANYDFELAQRLNEL